MTCKKNVLQHTGPALLAIIALDNDSATVNNLSRRLLADILEFYETFKSSIFSFRESMSSPASSVTKATPLSRRPLTKKIKNDSFDLENSLLSLCQTINKNLQGNRNLEVADSLNEIFAKLVVKIY